MAMIFSLLSLVFVVILIVAAVPVWITAFKMDTTKGLMVFCIPFYILYWVFKTEEFQHEKKPLIKQGLMVGYGGLVVCNILVRVLA